MLRFVALIALVVGVEGAAYAESVVPIIDSSAARRRGLRLVPTTIALEAGTRPSVALRLIRLRARRVGAAYISDVELVGTLPGGWTCTAPLEIVGSDRHLGASLHRERCHQTAESNLRGYSDEVRAILVLIPQRGAMKTRAVLSLSELLEPPGAGTVSRRDRHDRRSPRTRRRSNGVGDQRRRIGAVPLSPRDFIELSAQLE